MKRLAESRAQVRNGEFRSPFENGPRSNGQSDLLSCRLCSGTIDAICRRSREKHVRVWTKGRAKDEMIASNQSTGWVHKKRVGSTCIIKQNGRKEMPRTSAA